MRTTPKRGLTRVSTARIAPPTIPQSTRYRPHYVVRSSAARAPPLVYYRCHGAAGSRDLGFSASDRAESVRRASEVAQLFSEAVHNQLWLKRPAPY